MKRGRSARGIAAIALVASTWLSGCGDPRSSAGPTDAADRPPSIDAGSVPPPDGGEGARDAGPGSDADDGASDAALPPAAPVITSAQLEGVTDHQIRQGGTGTLVIEGSGLLHVTSARLGDIPVAVPTTATETALRLQFAIPHGRAPGMLTLVLANATGSAEAVDVLEVTPVVVSASGSGLGRGTFASPMLLCRLDWPSLLDTGDTLLVRDGVHPCDLQLRLPQGAAVRGESRSGTIVRGIDAASGRFQGFFTQEGSRGTTVIDNLTIEDAREAVRVGLRGSAAVTDVDVRGVSGTGVVVERGSARVDRYGYFSAGTGLAILDGGGIDASHVELHGAGVFVSGAANLSIAESDLSARTTGILIGGGLATGRPQVSVVFTTIHASGAGIRAETEADVTVRNTTIEGRNSEAFGAGIAMPGGVLVVLDSAIRGWTSDGIVLSALSPRAADTTLLVVRAEITTSQSGITFHTGAGHGSILMAQSHVSSQDAALTLLGAFTSIDLGKAASSGDNQLTSEAGGFALDDLRLTASADIHAHGTTLNGMTFQGDVVGPVDVSGAYSLLGPNTIHF